MPRQPGRSPYSPEPQFNTHRMNAPSTSSGNRYLQTIRCAWLIVLLVICVRVGISPHRQSVYSVDYVTAGWHWLHGQGLYTASRHFVYSPLVGAAFSPFAVLPLRLSNILWRLVCVAALVYTASAWLRSGLSGLGDVPSRGSVSASTTTAFLLLLPLAAGNLNVGQINVLVLAGTAAGVLAASRKHWNLAALLLAATGFMKIYPLAVGLLLALLYPRRFSWRLLLALAALFVLSLILQRPTYAWTQYGGWAAVLRGDDRLDIDLYSSWRDFGFLLRACGVPLSDQAYRVMEVAAGGALAVFLWLGQQRWGWSETRLCGGVFALGCAWMLLFGPATEAATYVVLSLPVCATLTAAWRLPGADGTRRARGLPAAFAVSYALLLLSDLANSWAHGGTHHLYMRALQPVAALIFTVGVVCWLLRRPTPVIRPA
jgi:hypothetical protein